MSKEVIKPGQFAKANLMKNDFAELSPAQLQELQELYEGLHGSSIQGQGNVGCDFGFGS